MTEKTFDRSMCSIGASAGPVMGGIMFAFIGGWGAFAVWIALSFTTAMLFYAVYRDVQSR